MKKHEPAARSTVKRSLRPLGPQPRAGTSPSAATTTGQSEAEFQRVVHELQVHQEELEAQNEELRETQQLLEASRDRYADLYDFAPIGYTTLDEKGHIREINLTGATILGRERSRLLGTLFSVAVAKSDLTAFHGHLRQCQQGSGPVTTELTLAVHNRAPVPVQLHSVPILDLTGQTTMYRTAITDITERKQAEEALRASEERFRQLANTMPDALFAGQNGKNVYANAAAACLLGAAAPEELVGLEIFDIIAPAGHETARQNMRRLLAGEKLPPFEKHFVRRDGSLVPVEVAVSLFTWHGRPAFQIVARDITERKNAEAERAKLVAVLEATTDFVGFADAKSTQVLYVNRAGRKMTGLAEDEDVTQLKIPDVHPEWTNRMLREVILPTAAREGVWTGECAFLNRDGRELPVMMVLLAHKSPSGEVVRFSTISRDITERKQAEAALRQARDELEDRVRKRTAELAGAVAELRNEISERERTEQTLRELSVRLLQTQDEERRRIARELHDSTGQKLAALAMNLSLIGKSAETLDVRARKALTESLALLDRSSRDIRTLSYLLHPPLLDERGLAAAVRWFADGFTQRSGVRVKLEVPPDSPRLPEEIEMALFRIVQEGLTNIHRHSQSSTATIRLMVDQNHVQLEMRDAGKGLPNPRSDGYVAPLGVGITGMRERVKQLGGQMKIDSGSRGTTVSVTLPLTKVAP
jgi:PAS domain S-box-containing protein